jgi:hypothetical protein
MTMLVLNPSSRADSSEMKDNQRGMNSQGAGGAG